jgi:hypothetical protein
MTRASWLRTIVAVALGTATAAGAQALATGKWTGSYMRRTNQGLQGTGLVVNIDSVQEGVLRGSVTIHGSQCAGDYPAAGRVTDGKVQIHTTEQGGRAGDCGLRLDLVLEGNRLRGTTGAGHPAELSR